MIQVIVTYTCPGCESPNLVRNGHDYKGSQKYHCKDCGRYGTLNAQPGYDAPMQAQVKRGVMERVSLRGLERMVSISRRTIQRWLTRWIADVPAVEFMGKLEAAQDTPEAQFVYQALSANMGSIESGGYFFWDPLAALVMADPGLVTLTPRTVTVVDVPGAEDGRTKPVANGPQIQVATQPDAMTFEQLFLDTLNS